MTLLDAPMAFVDILTRPVSSMAVIGAFVNADGTVQIIDPTHPLPVTGAGGGGSGGSVGAAGVNGTTAQSVQGITGGVPIAVSGTFSAVGGTASNGSDGQASQSGNSQGIGYGYIYNGATWDRQRGISGSTLVVLNQQLPNGTNIVGKVGIDQTAQGVTNGVVVNSSALPLNAATAANQTPPQTAGAALNGTTGERIMGSDGTNARDVLTTTTGALQPVTAAAGKITVNNVALTANTNTTLAAANTSRVGYQLKCDSGAVVVSETGATLAAATFGVAGQTVYIPSGSQPYFSPPIATRTAITAYTATAQTCVLTEFNS